MGADFSKPRSLAVDSDAGSCSVYLCTATLIFVYSYSYLWKKLRNFTRRSAFGKLIARFSKLVEHASREFPGVDGFEITGELGLIRWLSRNWDQDSYVLDVGANRGEWTAMALSMGCDKLQIRAFEPDSRLYGDLSSRFAGRETVKVENVGLASTAGELDLFLQPLGQDGGNSFTHPRTGVEDFCPPTVAKALTGRANVTTGDSYLVSSGITRVQLVKIDTEGFEMEVLRGFEESLRKGRIDYIQFEYNFAAARSKLNLEHFLDFLEPLGYRVGKLSYSGIDFMYQLEWNNYDSAPNFVAARKDLSEGISRVSFLEIDN